MRETVTRPSERAYDTLYEETYPLLYTFSRRRCASTADAEDLVATTFLIAWNNVDTFIRADSPLAWLFAVANKTLSNQSRSRRTYVSLDVWLDANDLAEAHSTETVVEKKIELEMAVQALEQLRKRDQELIRLAALEELTYNEIAIVMSSTEDRVRTDLFRARTRLKEAYKQQQKHHQGRRR